MADQDHPDPARVPSPGHHIGDGRNVVTGDTGRAGRDVFFAAVQMTRMPMCLSDPNRPDNPLVFVNQAFCELSGYAEDEIVGRNCRFLQGEATDPAAVAELRAAIATHSDVSVELYNYRKDGTGFWNALFLSPVFGPGGELLYFFGSQIDVTKRKQAEAVLARSQRMEALGSLAAGVAHEFNNLMTIIAGSIELAESRPSDARQSELLARAAWGAERAGRLTQQILSFSRRQFHDERREELSTLVRGLDSLVVQAAGARTEVRFALTEAPVPVWLDASQLELALLNLVRNSADAMPEGGVLTLRTTRETESGLDWAALEVADTGSGMAPEVAARAADPFFTTKEPGRGTGLGLSMVHGFVEQSGGRMNIASQAGDGTRVRILFPLAG